MASAYSKQPSSRPIKYQNLQYNSATVISTFFGPSVQQIRVAAQIGGWGTINQTTSDSIMASSAGAVGMIITAGTTSANSVVYTQSGPAEYFTVTPGQFFTFSSTSTSTGAISVTEMG